MRRPNILLLFSDQHNARFLQSAGHPDVKTPHLDRLASQGVRFERAYCQDGVCVPSRTSMLTGQYPRTTGCLYNPDPPSRPARHTPLQRYLRDLGYRTASFGKRHLPLSLDDGFQETATTLPKQFDPSDEYYWDWIKDQGQWEEFQRDWMAEFGYREDPNISAPLCSQLSELRPECTMEAYTAQKTIEYLKDAPNHDDPFFCWCSFYRPHQPYTPVAKWADRYPLDSVTLPASIDQSIETLPPGLQNLRRNSAMPVCLAKAAEDPTLYRRYIAYYTALVTEIDHYVGAVLRTLEHQGLGRDTIVIYTSDHGDFVGAHGLMEKAHQTHNVYEDTLRVPFIVRWPGQVRANHVSHDLVELVDLYPTLLSMIGAPPPQGVTLPGQSLLPHLQDGSPVRRKVAFSENWVMLSAIGHDHKLGAWIERPGDFPDMLFDRRRDPLETHNAVEEQPEAAAELTEAMSHFVGATPNDSGKPLAPERLA